MLMRKIASRSTMGRGALIVLEGCDRAGKSTQVKMLVNALHKFSFAAEAHTFPNRNTEIGAVINEYLSGKKDHASEVIHLLFSANRWESKEEMEKKLTAGTTIVLDRYAASGAAYGAANTGRDLSWCKSPDKGLPAPDLVAYLSIDEESQKSRCGWAEERYETAEFQKMVATNFTKLIDKTWKIVDQDDAQTMHSIILDAALNVIQAVKCLPLEKLYIS